MAEGLVDDVAVEQELLRSDEAVDVALAEADMDALIRLMAEDYRHTHSHGLRQSRGELFERMDGRDDLPVRERSNVTVEVHGDIAITAGDADIRYGGKRPDAYKRYVRVWRRNGAAWELISHHNLKATDREPAEAAPR